MREHGPQNQGDGFFRDYYTVSDEGHLYRRLEDCLLLVVPHHLLPRVLYYYHDLPLGGHPGVEETARAFQAYFHSLNIDTVALRYVNGCRI